MLFHSKHDAIAARTEKKTEEKEKRSKTDLEQPPAQDQLARCCRSSFPTFHKPHSLPRVFFESFSRPFAQTIDRSRLRRLLFCKAHRERPPSPLSAFKSDSQDETQRTRLSGNSFYFKSHLSNPVSSSIFLKDGCASQHFVHCKSHVSERAMHN